MRWQSRRHLVLQSCEGLTGPAGATTKMTPSHAWQVSPACWQDPLAPGHVGLPEGCLTALSQADLNSWLPPNQVMWKRSSHTLITLHRSSHTVISTWSYQLHTLALFTMGVDYTSWDYQDTGIIWGWSWRVTIIFIFSPQPIHILVTGFFLSLNSRSL